MSEESKNDVVKEARAFISIVGNCGLYPDNAQRWISALCDEVEELRRRNETQADSIMEFQEEQRAFRAALQEAAIEAHVGFQHPRQWEDCDLNSCCERKRLIGGHEINGDSED